MIWDTIAVNEAESNDPQYIISKTERMALWSGTKIGNFDKRGTSHKGVEESSVVARITTHQGTVSRVAKPVPGNTKDKNKLIFFSLEEVRKTKNNTRQ